MGNKNFFVDGGTVQAQEGAIYLRRKADDQLLALCRQGTFAYVLTARQMGKSSLMVNTAEQLSEEGVRTAEIDLTRIGVKVTKEEWYLGILFEIRAQLGLRQDVISWWRAPERQALSTAQRLLLFFEQVVLVEVSDPVVIFVDEIETTLRLGFTDDFFAAVRSIHNARSGRRFERLAFVLIGAATPDSLIRDQQLTPFNIGRSVVLADFTLEEALPLADGFGLSHEDARRVLSRVLHWSGGHPYLTQRLCRSIAEEQRGTWADSEVDEAVARAFFGDRSHEDKNLHFVREVLLKSDLNREILLATYREILQERRPVLDEEQSLIKTHLKLSGIVKRERTALRVRNPIYREVFNEAWVKNNTPVNWTRRLTRVAAAVLLAVLLVSTILAPYAWRQKLNADRALGQAEEALNTEISLRRQLQQANDQLAETNRQLSAAKEEAEKQNGIAQIAARQEKLAKEDAEVQRTLALSERDRARSAESAAEKAQRTSFISKLILTEQALASRGTNLQHDRAIVAREAFLQAKQAEAQTSDALVDDPLSALAYQDLMEITKLLPRSTTIPFTGDQLSRVRFTEDGQKLMGFDADGQTLQIWDLKSQQLSARKIVGQGRVLQYHPNGKYVARAGQGASIGIHELESDRGFVVEGSVSDDSLPTPRVVFNPVDDYALICPCSRFGPTAGGTYGLWRIKDGQKIADIVNMNDLVQVGFSRDGRFIHVVGVTGKVQVFEARTGRAIVNREESKAPESTGKQAARAVTAIPGSDITAVEVEAVVFSENGNFLVTATPQVAEVWDLSDAQAIRKMATIIVGTGRLSSVESGLAISNDGRLLTVFGETRSVINLWNVRGGRVLHSINASDAPHHVVFNADGTKFTTISESSFRIWDVETGSEIYRAVDEKDFRDFGFNRVGSSREIRGFDFSHDGNYLATVNEDGLARLWKLTDDEHSVRKLISVPNGGDYSEDKQYLVTINQEANQDPKLVKVWDLRAGRVVATRAFEQRVVRATFSMDGEKVAVVTIQDEAHTAWLWPWRKSEAGALHQASFAAEEVQYISLSRDGKYLAALVRGDKPVVRIMSFNQSAGAGKQSWDLSAQHAESIKFIPNTDFLAILSKVETQLWDIHSNRPVGGLIGQVKDTKKASQSAAYSENGMYVTAFSEETKTVNVAEAATGKIVGRLSHPKGVQALDINYDGRLIVSVGEEDKMMRVWVWDGQPRVINEVRYEATTVAISRDGKYVASTAGNDSVRIWDISRPGAILEVARIQPGEGAVQAFFSPDARYLHTFKGSLAQVWRWQASQLVCEATNRLTKKDLSLEDWAGKKYVLPNERHFLNAQQRPAISCGVERSEARQ